MQYLTPALLFGKERILVYKIRGKITSLFRQKKGMYELRILEPKF